MNSESQSTPVTDAQQLVSRFQSVFDRLRSGIQTMFVGQDELVEHVIGSLFASGHVLIEGVPGLGKTLLVRTLASAVDVEFSRIQFTPDLMPADVSGTTTLQETPGGGHELRFEPGPLIASIVLADEINRATPKTQSALLEAMQERQVTAGRRTIPMPEPFMVLATQNPVEQEGTYPLPEAQLDRFLVKLLVNYPQEDEYLTILRRTTDADVPVVSAVTNGEEVIQLRSVVRQVVVSEQVSRYAIRMIMATQPGSAYAPSSAASQIALGASPRGVQALILLGKVQALKDGRFSVSCADIRRVALPVLRHRIQLSFEAQAKGITADEIVESAIAAIPELSDV